MLSLIVTNTHKNKGEVVDLDFTDQKYYYSDDQGRVYTLNDFVDVDAINHEQAKAIKLIEYSTGVLEAIQKYKRLEGNDGKQNR